MKNYEDMSVKEKKAALGEVYSLYNLYGDFEMTYNALPNDLKEKLNKEFEYNKPDELIRTLSIVVRDLYDIADELYQKAEVPNKEDGGER